MTTVGQFTVPADAALQVAATQIASSTQTDAQAAGLVPAYRQATIISVDGGTPPTCTATFDGTTNVAGIRFLQSYFPTANDTVVCIALDGTTWILGELATATPQTLTVPALTVNGDATVSGTLNGTSNQVAGSPVTGLTSGGTSGITYLCDMTPPHYLCVGQCTVDFNGTAGARSATINAGAVVTTIYGGVGACMLTNNTAVTGVPVNVSGNTFQMQYTAIGTVSAGNRSGYFIVWGHH